MIADRAHALLSLLQQINLISTNLIRPELIRRPMEMFREVLQRLDVGRYGSLRVISPLSYGARWPAKPHENEVVSPAVRSGEVENSLEMLKPWSLSDPERAY